MDIPLWGKRSIQSEIYTQSSAHIFFSLSFFQLAEIHSSHLEGLEMRRVELKKKKKKHKKILRFFLLIWCLTNNPSPWWPLHNVPTSISLLNQKPWTNLPWYSLTAAQKAFQVTHLVELLQWEILLWWIWPKIYTPFCVILVSRKRN